MRACEHLLANQRRVTIRGIVGNFKEMYRNLHILYMYESIKVELCQMKGTKSDSQNLFSFLSGNVANYNPINNNQQVRKGAQTSLSIFNIESQCHENRTSAMRKENI